MSMQRMSAAKMQSSVLSEYLCLPPIISCVSITMKKLKIMEGHHSYVSRSILMDYDREMHLDYQSCMTGDSPEDDAAYAGVEEVESPAASEDGGDQSEDEETDQGGDQTTLIKIKSFKTDPRQNAIRKQFLTRKTSIESGIGITSN